MSPSKRLILTAMAVTLLGGSVPAQRPIRVVVRVDDIQSRNTTTLPRSIVPFEQAVASRGGHVTWVTIPHRLIESQNTDGVLARELRASVAGGHEIAQHGYNHICTLCGNTGHEMWCATRNQGFTFSQQQSFIQDGKRILLDSLGVTPTSFVSPGHYEDSVTYAVLANTGFRYISTTRVTTGPVNASLFNLGSPNEYTWSLTTSAYTPQLTTALADARRIGDSTGVFVLLHHDPFIRQGYSNGIVIRWTGEFLDSMRATYGQRLRLLTLSQAIEELRTPTPVVEVPNLPVRAKLGVANYPNPFNPSTVLRIRSYSKEPLRVSVVDLLGRVVLSFRETIPAVVGTNDVRIEASFLPSGVYFALIRQGAESAVGKIILQK